jgi:hypothetical protein
MSADYDANVPGRTRYQFVVDEWSGDVALNDVDKAQNGRLHAGYLRPAHHDNSHDARTLILDPESMLSIS